MNTATERTETKKTVLLSKKGMKELRKTIAQLEHDRLQLIRGLHELGKTTSHDDRLERVERLSRLEAVDNELAEKKQTLAAAKLIPSHSARLKVALGSVVEMIDQQGRMLRYTIVDSIEANPSDGRISIASPLGRNLIGKTVHDIVEWGSDLTKHQVRLVRIA